MQDHNFGFWPFSCQLRINLSPKTGNVEAGITQEVETHPGVKIFSHRSPQINFADFHRSQFPKNTVLQKGLWVPSPCVNQKNSVPLRASPAHRQAGRCNSVSLLITAVSPDKKPSRSPKTSRVPCYLASAYLAKPISLNPISLQPISLNP